MEKWPIGIFTSINAGLGAKLEVARELGVSTIQLHALRKASRNQATADRFLAQLQEMNIILTAMFGGFEGESYAGIPTVARTVGLVPQETRAARLAEMRELADFAKVLNCHVVALHLGFVPHEPHDPQYGEMLTVARELCDHCRGNNQSLHLETGQEPADVLLQFIQAVDRDNLYINFDPANMIMYGAGNPIEALATLGGLVRSVHCKDAKWAQRPGKEWGKEVPLGQGDVGFPEYLRMLKQIGYEGPLTIERELPQEPDRQRAEIQHAVGLLEKLKQQILV